MNLLNRLKKNDYICVFMICFLLAFLSLVVFIIQGHGFFIIRDDFNEQQIPFTIGLHKSLIDSGFSGFSWCLDLGTSTMQGYGFYELGSPFFWLSMIFPAQIFPYIVAWIFMLKYAVAGLFAYIYLKLFVQQNRYAYIGAILYAFSGFSTVNIMYYHFHDVIALFPLLLIGLELAIRKKDYRLLTFAIFINAFLNYFFFVGAAIFLIVYYLFRFFNRDLKARAKEILSCLLSGIVGVGMAAILFIPSIMYISQSSRSTSSFTLENLIYSFRYILFNIKGILLPAEAMTDISAIFPSKFYSTAAYLPLFGTIFVITYIIKNRDWLSRLLIFCFVAAFVPMIGRIFFLYMDPQNRWWHCFVLMMSLATCLVLENHEEYKKHINISALINILLICILFISAFVFKDTEGSSFIYSRNRFILYILIGLVGCFITAFLYNKQLFSSALPIVFVSVFACLTTALTVYVYRSNGKPVEVYKEQYDIACQVELPDSQYRLNNASNVFSMVNNVSGFSLFTSTDSVGITEFESLFDYYDPVNGLNKNDYPGLAELLGGKYYITNEYPETGSTIAVYYSNDIPYYLVETNACPIGFAIDSYITESDLKDIPAECRAIALLQAAVVDDSIPTDSILGLNRKYVNDVSVDYSIEEACDSALKKSVSNFSKDGHGFTCSSSYKNDTFVYFSVPYDKGWTATIDGASAEIINSGGMILVAVPAGNHNIVFKYITPGYYIGLAVSIISWLIFIVFCVLFYLRNKAK